MAQTLFITNAINSLYTNKKMRNKRNNKIVMVCLLINISISPFVQYLEAVFEYVLDSLMV